MYTWLMMGSPQEKINLPGTYICETLPGVRRVTQWRPISETLIEWGMLSNALFFTVDT